MSSEKNASRGDGEECCCSQWFRSSDDVRTGAVSGGFGSKQVQYSAVGGRAIFEGDICLGASDGAELASDSSTIARGIGLTGEQFRWPNGRVPFEIDAGVPAATRTTIQNAIQHWHDRTQIRLSPRSGEANYVRFIASDGCWSHVGMRGGMQEISLGAGCGFGAAVHEIGHAVGLWHEQSREDRDANVRVQWANIQSGREHNFNQHITDGDDIGAYDFQSIMHYPATAFSKNGQPTIVTLSGQAIGQRNALSDGDVAAVRALYPQLEPSPRTTRLFRYWNGTTGDHFYTTNWDELGGGRGGYVYEGVQCYIYSEPAFGSTPLYRYWNASATDHFYTTNWSELGAGRYGWGLEGIQGYVLASPQPGTVALHRYWNAANGDHFYTTNWSELGGGAHGWGYEGVQCYVHTAPPASASADPAGAELAKWSEPEGLDGMVVNPTLFGSGKAHTNGTAPTSFSVQASEANGSRRAVTIRLELDQL
jgi:hypothetical protein